MALQVARDGALHGPLRLHLAARDLRLPAAHRAGPLPQAREPAEHAAGAKDLRLPLHAPAGLQN